MISEKELKRRMDFEHSAKRINLIKALIAVDGDLEMGGTSIARDGSVTMGGYKRNYKELASVNYYIEKSVMEELNQVNTFDEMYEIYKEIGYFEEV
ncbi:hypothetical protein JCM19037_1623 [Geomicrobium sp. JCM 19037]|uniref:hypothetical protein n=1 Tax=Geomicrobium sp. JCM 19037 TaxID=1460634 RepID=UPI00045F1CC1|nr:hypothetical protein [Geomicrobium sp. JCM 19037]GAK03309.1 hypothetical protein JCM19037_1623 [Geomicrobium sp. JCM 19037]